MKVRTMLAVTALALAGSLSGCVIQQSDAPRTMRGGSSMMSMTFSEPSYLAQMIPHHEEAVEAARELARSPRAEMRELGDAIVQSQTAQIDRMRGWLERWYPDEPQDTAYRPMMRDLSGLEGDALDRVFLQDMVRHHMMAVMMSQQLLGSRAAEHEEVADLARGISIEQRREIRQMRSWLWEWFGERSMGMMSGW